MTHGFAVVGISISLTETFRASTVVLLGTIALFGFLLIAGLSYLRLPQVLQALNKQFSSAEAQDIYQNAIAPRRGWLSWTIVSISVDSIALALPVPDWFAFLEFPLGLLVALNLTVLGFALLEILFDKYLLSVALENQQKINSELLVLAKFIADATIVLIVIAIFAQTHKINLFGLIASLGVGGVAIAFASQKVLEQILWSIVLYLDSPFIVDDYIHLPDSTIGRVESIGWRSTKIRLSGKNTLVIVPNSQLAQNSIENLTRARRTISLVRLSLFKAMSAEEKALVYQLIIESTSDILGIDRNLTQITFEDATDAAGQDYVQAQLIFYILGAAENSMEVRSNLLDIAKTNIIERLQDRGLDFSFEEKTLDIAQPMNI